MIDSKKKNDPRARPRRLLLCAKAVGAGAAMIACSSVAAGGGPTFVGTAVHDADPDAGDDAADDADGGADAPASIDAGLTVDAAGDG